MPDEMDQALAGLELPPEDTPTDQATSPKPPPRPRTPRRPTDRGEGATRLDGADLFALEPQKKLEAGAGPEAKVAFLRERLKAAEKSLARARQAWDGREAEIDSLGADLAEARRRAEVFEQKVEELVPQLTAARRKNASLREKVKTLEAFIRKKRTEFDNYAAKVQAVFVEQNRAVKVMRKKLLQSERYRRAAKENRDDINDLESSMEALDSVSRRRHTIIDNLQRELEFKDSESERLLMALRAERAKAEAVLHGDQDAMAMDRLQMALRAESAKVAGLQEKVETLELVVQKLRRALRAEKGRTREES